MNTALRTVSETKENVFLLRKLINSLSNDGISTWGNSKTTYSNWRGRESETDPGGRINISPGLALVIYVHSYWKQKKERFQSCVCIPQQSCLWFPFCRRFSFLFYPLPGRQNWKTSTNSYSPPLTSPPDINLGKLLAAFGSINMLVLSLDWRMHVTTYVCCSPFLQQRNWRREGKERKFLTCSSAVPFLPDKWKTRMHATQHLHE